MHRVYFARPIIADKEREYMARALSNPVLTDGAFVTAFQQAFTDMVGGGLALATNSCMSALQLACMSLFRKGDEVIVPALSHVATAHCVELSGAEPVFVDIDHKTGNMDYHAVERRITARTKGIIIVHYLGRPSDPSAFKAIARKRGIHLIEDCALALGASEEGTHVGLFGDVGCFSFYPCKHITTGEGGMLLTRDTQLMAQLKKRRSFGQKERYGDVPYLGFNGRMSELQAALGLAQLERLPYFLKSRQHNYLMLKTALSNIPRVNSDESSFYGMSVFLPKGMDRDEFRMDLKRVYIEASAYYPKPLPYLSYYKKKYGYMEGQFPEAEFVSSRTVCLPVGPHLKKKHMRYLAQTIQEKLCGSHLSAALAS